MITYIIESQGLYKIGKTKNWGKRRMAYNTHNPNWKLILLINKNIELELHEYFKNKRVSGEWFDLLDEDLNIIKKVCNVNNIDILEDDIDITQLSMSASTLYFEILKTKHNKYISAYNKAVSAFSLSKSYYEEREDGIYCIYGIPELLEKLFITSNEITTDNTTTCFLRAEVEPIAKRLGLDNRKPARRKLV